MTTFSIITPVFRPELRVFQSTVKSVMKQKFTDWELILVDDCSGDPRLSSYMRRISRRDPRVTVISRAENGGIVNASNDGVAVATGEFLALLDHDDLLAPNALSRVAETIAQHENVDYIYTDEDKVDSRGAHYDVFRKPDWSPERLRGQMYTSHLSVMRTALVQEVGAFRPGYDGSQDHDLALRVTERAREIVHIPEVLYHWRAVDGSTAASGDNKPYAWDAGVRAVSDHLQRIGVAATAERGPVPGTYRIVREPELNRSVSVIIPTRGDSGTVGGTSRVFVVEAVRSILEGSNHSNLEIVVVYDSNTPQSVLDQLQEIAGDRLLLVEYTHPFNFSQKCNVGYLASRGEILLFLNDDVETISPELPGQMAAALAEPTVGMVGAKLLFESGSLQHGGHLYENGQFTHAYYAASDESYGDFSSLLINREASGLTAACIALRREVFEEAGGFCELLPVNFNDVDFSMKIRFLGYRLVWLTDVILYHFESQTRVPVVHAFEVLQLLDRWGSPGRDPYRP